MIKVSIIIPVYNVENYLVDCLESLLRQTLKQIEIICINDGSSDASQAILDRYAGVDHRFKIINNLANFGQSYSRNKGLEIAQGKYIYFLDSDDMIVPETLAELYELAETYGLDAVLFDASLLFESDLLRKQFIGYTPSRRVLYPDVYTGEELFSKLVQNGDWSASPPRQFWRSHFLKKHKILFYEGIIHEDELFSFIAIIKAAKIMAVDKKYFIRRFRNSSTMTTTISEKNFEGKFVCYCEMLAFWQQHKFSEVTNSSIDGHLTNFYKSLMQSYRVLRFDIGTITHGGTVAKHLLKVFANNEKGNLYNLIDEEKLRIIQNYKHVIIYGAGTVARDVLKVLDINQIGILAFAVSSTVGNPSYIMGTRVYGIQELLEYTNSAIIIVSVIEKHRNNIIRTLDQLGFNNVVVIG